ncbi:Low-density lipoprotein receptor-related protein 2 [Manis javanica]|nr:Low-density lipoprotein receptor-related protein 2 [Manis javanica]
MPRPSPGIYPRAQGTYSRLRALGLCWLRSVAANNAPASTTPSHRSPPARTRSSPAFSVATDSALLLTAACSLRRKGKSYWELLLLGAPWCACCCGSPLRFVRCKDLRADASSAQTGPEALE